MIINANKIHHPASYSSTLERLSNRGIWTIWQSQETYTRTGCLKLAQNFEQKQIIGNPPFMVHWPNILPREKRGGGSNEGDTFGKLHYRRSILMNKGRGGPFDSLRK